MKTTTTTQIMLMIGIMALLSTFISTNAFANTVDGPVIFADQLVSASNASVQAPKSSNRSSKSEFNAKRVTQLAAAASAAGAAVGSTEYARALQARAWLDPVPMVDYPLEVKYMVQEKGSLSKQALLWGIPVNELLAMNPGLTEESVLQPRTELTVLKRVPWGPKPLSVGATNRGRVLNGWLMPEGSEESGYYLRNDRQRSYATETTIVSLMSGFAAYAQAYPGGNAVNVGDLSKRRGGKIKPHASHQAGRDVDIGFVHTGDVSNSHQHFTRASSTNLDVEKTWFMIKSIIATGNVKSIYVDRMVQKQLYEFAKRELDEKQLDVIFSYPKRENSKSAMMQHWPGHRNHFHIRFVCPDDQPRCRR